MCFITGTIIFEDNNNVLYNFLTHGIISNNLGCIDISKYPQLSISHVTGTHMKIFNKTNIKSNDTCFDFTNSNLICSDKKCFKLELIFNNPLEYICDKETFLNMRDEKNKSEKGVLLYYKFINNSNGNKYIFFKLEQHDMNSISHAFNFLYQQRNDTYNNRRENEGLDDYNEILNNKGGGFFDFFTFTGNDKPEPKPEPKHVSKYATKTNDVEFYNKLDTIIRNNQSSFQLNQIIPQIAINKASILEKVSYYNENIRTGAELFIMEELKNYLLKDYININKFDYLIIK